MMTSSPVSSLYFNTPTSATDVRYLSIFSKEGRNGTLCGKMDMLFRPNQNTAPDWSPGYFKQLISIKDLKLKELKELKELYEKEVTEKCELYEDVTKIKKEIQLLRCENKEKSNTIHQLSETIHILESQQNDLNEDEKIKIENSLKRKHSSELKLLEEKFDQCLKERNQFEEWKTKNETQIKILTKKLHLRAIEVEELLGVKEILTSTLAECHNEIMCLRNNCQEFREMLTAQEETTTRSHHNISTDDSFHSPQPEIIESLAGVVDLQLQEAKEELVKKDDFIKDLESALEHERKEVLRLSREAAQLQDSQNEANKQESKKKRKRTNNNATSQWLGDEFKENNPVYEAKTEPRRKLRTRNQTKIEDVKSPSHRRSRSSGSRVLLNRTNLISGSVDDNGSPRKRPRIKRYYANEFFDQENVIAPIQVEEIEEIKLSNQIEQWKKCEAQKDEVSKMQQKYETEIAQKLEEHRREIESIKQKHQAELNRKLQETTEQAKRNSETDLSRKLETERQRFELELKKLNASLEKEKSRSDAYRKEAGGWRIRRMCRNYKGKFSFCKLFLRARQNRRESSPN